MHSLLIFYILSISSVLSVMHCFTHMITARTIVPRSTIGLKVKRTSTKDITVLSLLSFILIIVINITTYSLYFSDIIAYMLLYYLIMVKQLRNLKQKCL